MLNSRRKLHIVCLQLSCPCILPHGIILLFGCPDQPSSWLLVVQKYAVTCSMFQQTPHFPALMRLNREKVAMFPVGSSLLPVFLSSSLLLVMQVHLTLNYSRLPCIYSSGLLSVLLFLFSPSWKKSSNLGISLSPKISPLAVSDLKGAIMSRYSMA